MAASNHRLIFNGTNTKLQEMESIHVESCYLKLGMCFYFYFYFILTCRGSACTGAGWCRCRGRACGRRREPFGIRRIRRSVMTLPAPCSRWLIEREQGWGFAGHPRCAWYRKAFPPWNNSIHMDFFLYRHIRTTGSKWNIYTFMMP